MWLMLFETWPGIPRRQIALLLQRPVSIVGNSARHRKRGVDSGQKLGFQVVIGLLKCLDTNHPHALHQAILSCDKSAFHAALGLRTMGRYPYDSQLLQGPADLRGRQLRPVPGCSGFTWSGFLAV